MKVPAYQGVIAVLTLIGATMLVKHAIHDDVRTIPAPSAAVAAPGPADSHSMATTIQSCLKADRRRWLNAPMPDADLAELWGGREWIQRIADPALRLRYQDAYDLFASRHDIASRALLSDTNRAAGPAAPQQARTVESLMGDQYSTDHIADMALDAEWIAALQTAATQWASAQTSLQRISTKARPFASLVVEGTIYNDAFAVTCGEQAFHERATEGDRLQLAKALTPSEGSAP